MFLRNDETSEGVKFAILSRSGGGGACIALTKQAVLVGVWNKEADQSDGKK